MSKSLGDKISYFPFWLLNSIILFCFLASPSTTAQIVPDATLPVNSSITPQNNITTITGGTTAGGNLFHSFEQFSVPTGGEAFFDNAPDIQNIVSRVTGSSVSNIDGLIRANGTANLFLLNPNGIIFGPKASLNIGGSFLASTASSLNFADGTQFNAPAPPTTPLLTVSVPLGLQFGSNPGVIRVQGTGHSLTLSSPIFSPFKSSSSTGLQVNPGKTLAFLGGDVALEGGTLKAAGGRIELGSVTGPSLVSLTSIDKGWTLNYEGVSTFGDMHFKQRAAVDASGVGSGSIQVQGAHVTLTDGSVILIQNQGSQTGGSLSLKASESLEVNGASSDGMIPTSLINETVRGGNGGDIGITTKKLIVQGGAGISTRTYSTAKGGDLTVNAPESIQVIGFSPVASSVFSLIATGTFSSGSAGDITVNTKRLTARTGGNVGSITLGKGSGGNLTANATDVELNGVAPTSMPSALFASTGNTGNAGGLTVNASRVTIKNGAVISSSTAAPGNSGSITINASDFVEVSGSASIPPMNTSSIVSAAIIQTSFLQQAFGLPSIPSGTSGDVTINTRQLTVTDRGQVDVRNEGPGNAGTLRVNAPSIFLGNFGRLVAATTSGKGGDIILKAQNLQSRHNGLITATAVGSGDGGNVTINTKILVSLEDSNITAKTVQGRGGNLTIDTDALVGLKNSDISANALQGQGGNIQITTQALFLSPDSQITASSDLGIDGRVEINTPDIDLSSGLTTLPTQPVDVTGLIAQGCPGSRGNVGTGVSEFIVTGRGGLPPYQPGEPLTTETITVNRDSLEREPLTTETITVNGDSLEAGAENRSAEVISNPSRSTPSELVEAQGWVFNDKGEIVLTAYPTNATPYSSSSTPTITCYAP